MFHAFVYLPKQVHNVRLKEFVYRFGAGPTYPTYKNYLKTPETFLKALDLGVYTDFFERGPGVPRPLAMSVQSAEGASPYLRFVLEVDAIFSPERDRLQSLSHRSDEQETRLAALNRAQRTFEGKAGFAMAEPNQAALADEGYVLVTIGGDFLGDHHGREMGIDSAALRQEQRNSLITMLDTLAPDYAFFANQNDYELWHMGPIERFPPTEPWRYLWLFMVFGSPLIEQFGQARLLTTPAFKREQSGAGLIYIQPFEAIFHPYEVLEPDHTARKEQKNLILQHLNLIMPYSTFL